VSSPTVIVQLPVTSSALAKTIVSGNKKAAIAMTFNFLTPIL